MISPSRTLAVLGTTACTLVLATVPASAADSSLILTKQGPGVASVAGLPRVATLSCEPGGGIHPNKEAACAALTQADGDFDHIESTSRLCTMDYSPVYASATGTWHGRKIGWTATFPNDCAAAAQTGMVFAF
jgi:hypothetical protein